jgi:hypothetical protein
MLLVGNRGAHGVLLLIAAPSARGARGPGAPSRRGARGPVNGDLLLLLRAAAAAYGPVDGELMAPSRRATAAYYSPWTVTDAAHQGEMRRGGGRR